jgi:hypothetical protein
MRSVFLLAALALAGPAMAARDCDPNCDAAWAKFTSITLNAIDTGSPVSAQWRVQFDHTRQDIRIDADIPGPSGRMRGTIAMVGGRVLMTKGLVLPRGGELNAIDTPILAIKLLTAVLGRAVPVSPEKLVKEQAIKYRETGVGIRFATPSAEGYLAAPWTAEGKVTKIANGDIAYDVRVVGPSRDAYGRTAPPIDTRFSGRLSNARPPILDDAMALEGWTAYASHASEWKTLRDVRAGIEQALNPGVRDATKNFTGLWKRNCADDTALQVKPAGNDGMYSVSFCSPSGCFDPGTTRPSTFINGDPHYKVVSEMEIQVEGAEGFTTFQKCSSNPEPSP